MTLTTIDEISKIVDFSGDDDENTDKDTYENDGIENFDDEDEKEEEEESEDMSEENDDDEEEGSGKSKIKFAPLAVFCTFFIAELGDKTQLTAITFGANEGMSAALVVWIGCSLGLFAADILGMLVGYLLKSKTPDGLPNTLAFAIFSIFGVFTLYQGLKLISSSVCRIPVLLILIAVVVIFAGLCAFLFVRQKKKKEEKI